MEFDTSPINRCSKEHEKIYQQWFNFADSGKKDGLFKVFFVQMRAKRNDF